MKIQAILKVIVAIDVRAIRIRRSEEVHVTQRENEAEKIYTQVRIVALNGTMLIISQSFQLA